MSPGSRPRVLVVEDDESIRRFLELALEDEPVELVMAGTLAAAREALGRPPYVLLLTDLMLPDGSGLDLLQSVVDQPALRGAARLAVFSAGVSAATRARLEALGVQRVLMKPAPLAAVIDCVRWATSTDDATSVPASVTEVAATGSAVDEFFAGDRTLYDGFRASCIEQFPRDVAAGDAALAGGDWAALRRLAHGLKTVLRSLGHGADSALAAQLEDDAAAGRADAARGGWRQLRERLPSA